MKKYVFLLMTFLLLLSSCEFEENNHGYSKRIKFQSNGGTEIILGEIPFTHISIADGTDEYSPPLTEDKYYEVSHKWLTIKTLRGSNCLTITAEPNNTNKKRKLIIYGYFGNEYAVIKVTQDP